MDNIIHRSLKLHCNPERAFEHFTEDKSIESWLVNLAEVEPVIGGKYELFWEPDDRENNSTIGCKVTAIEPNQLIAFEWRSPKQYKHFANQADPLTHVVVSFYPEGEWTNVHLFHSGWRGTPEWEEARQWQEKAWSVAFEVLGKKINEIQT
jgi:uncharacterized protein YndB with AHSA1/START domain